MGDIIAFSDDIEQMGRDFGTASNGVYEVLTELRQASDHVRRAFHNHPDKTDAAVAPFKQLHDIVEQVEQLAGVLAVTLIDVAHSYRTSDATVANTWDQAGNGAPPTG